MNREHLGIDYIFSRAHRLEMEGSFESVMPVACAVTDRAGNHCPGQATARQLKPGEETFLCDKCYQNAMQGAYSNA